MKPVKRSFGVTVLAIVAIIAGILGLITSFNDFGGLGLLGGGAVHQMQTIEAGLDAFLLILSVLYIVFGIGALQLQPWAWGLGVALAILTVLDVGVKAVTAHIGSNDWFDVVIAVLILVYLFTSRVREEFGRK